MATTKTAPKEQIEVCIGCGAEATRSEDEQGIMQGGHPIIVVVNKADTYDLKPAYESLDNPNWKGMACCKTCHENPAKRKQLIKGHFFERPIGRYAVMRAGSQDLGV